MKLKQYRNMERRILDFRDGARKPYLTSEYTTNNSTDSKKISPNEFIEYLESTDEKYSIEDRMWIENHAPNLMYDERLNVSACINSMWSHVVKIELKENQDPFDMIQFFR